MAINTIDTTTPLVGLKAGADVINGNFTDTDNAASRLMATETQAKDGTAGVVPDAAGVHAAIRGLAVGTVSQSVGVPTGAIIERGSNANGEFVKYADGTIICTHNIVFTIPNASNLSVAWTLPSSFINDGYISNAQWRGAAPGSSAVFYSNALNTTSSVRFYSSTINGSDFADVGTTREASAVAIGRWY